MNSPMRLGQGAPATRVLDPGSGPAEGPRIGSSRYLYVLVCAYLAIALIGGGLLCSRIPPFQAPDEPNHFFRAFQVSQGQLWAKWRGAEFGGEIDGGYAALLGATFRLIGNPTEKLSARDVDALWALKVDGSRHFADFPNTANYSAIGYVPQAIGIGIARMFTDAAAAHLFAARFANLASLAVAVAIAIVLFPAGAPAFLWLSSLPMVLWLAASASQDATIISLSVLLIASLLRLVAAAPERNRDARRALAVGAVILLLLSIVRPPLLPLVLLLPACAYARGQRSALWGALILAALITACTVAYMLFIATGGVLRFRPEVDPAGQARFILTQPLSFLAILADTMATNWGAYRRHFIGVLGWLELPLPAFAYIFLQSTGVLTCVALVLSFARLPWERLEFRGSRALLVAGVALGTAAISALLFFAVQYIIWTALHGGLVEGVQGRYFYAPLIVLVPMLVAALATVPAVHGPCRKLEGALPLSAIVSAALLGTIVWSGWLVVSLAAARYYS